MRAELLQLAADLAKRGEPFVLAMVVRRESYSSAQQGDMAVITADGSYHGWLGGNCTRPSVKREAILALSDGKPRLVSLSPQPEERAGVIALPMTCHSGGSVDIYLEPVLPAPRLLVYGDSPCARALQKLGEVMGYSRTAERGPVYAIVATMGENDEESLAQALAQKPAYAAVVASRKRFAEIRESLIARGVDVSSVRNPAGLDIGARTPEEVALSIFAEIVQLRRAAKPAPVELPALEIDPVCGMKVEVATAKHVAEHEGRKYYFCNPRCREKFLAKPDQFLAA